MEFLVAIGQLDSFAGKFWNYVQEFRVFAFHGNMGAGKTTIINALCHFKGVEDVTASPSFSIINEYQYIENGSINSIFHIDLYRLKDEEEVIEAGIEDVIYSGSVCMVEWPDKAPGIFDRQTVHIYVEIVSESERVVRIKLPG